MGMFDSIYLNGKCPYCEKKSEMEFQTKDLDCLLRVFRKGDRVSEQYKYLFTYASCGSKDCFKMFTAKVFLDKRNRISGKFEVVELLNSGNAAQECDTTEAK